MNCTVDVAANAHYIVRRRDTHIMKNNNDPSDGLYTVFGRKKDSKRRQQDQNNNIVKKQGCFQWKRKNAFLIILAAFLSAAWFCATATMYFYMTWNDDKASSFSYVHDQSRQRYRYHHRRTNRNKNANAEQIGQQKQKQIQTQTRQKRQNTGQAKMCAYYKGDDGSVTTTNKGQCHVEACNNNNNDSNSNNTLTLPEFMTDGPHYGYGFVQRDPSILLARDRGGHPIQMQITGSASAGSGCAVSHKYKFLYIHVLKSGGMTLKTFLKMALCGSTQKPCQQGNHVLEIVNCGTAVQQYQDYFVWSFVRNPFSRMYSAYAMAMEYRGHNTQGTSRTIRQRRKSTTQNTTTKPEFTFEEFVLKGRGSSRGSLSHMSPVHFAPQTRFLFDAKDCPVFDYLGHLETFHDDLKTVLQHIGSPEMERYFYQNFTNAHGTVHKSKDTSYGSQHKQKELQGGNLQRAYKNDDANINNNNNSRQKIQEAVAREFAKDFSLLGYDPTRVPPN